MENFIKNIFKNLGPKNIIVLISSFIFELIMILVFLEIIGIHCYGLNENLKKNIYSRGIIDSSLLNEDDDNEDIDVKFVNNNEINEKNDLINKY